MRASKILIMIFVFLGFTFMGYQCGSTELTSAKLYIQQKNYDKAMESLKNEVQKNPKSDEGYYLLGYVYGENGQYSEMMGAFNKSLSISKNFEENVTASRVYHWANLFNKGVKEYQEGVNSQNEDSSKIILDKAADSFKSAIIIEPDSVDTYKNLAFVYMNTGDLDKAEEPLRVVIEKERALDGYRFLGDILYERGVNQKETDSIAAMETFNENIKILEEGRKYYPNSPDILLTLSNSYIAADKLDIAKDVFKAGVEAEPENKYYRYNYGVLLLGGNQFEEAEAQFIKAIELDSTYENALYNLGVTYIRWGTFLNKAAEEKGETSSGYREKYQMALPYMEKVVQMKSDDASVWELIGRVYTVLGMQEDATNAFSKADSLRK
jgi:tetratricopeptide (TPR) repeat protein